MKTEAPEEAVSAIVVVVIAIAGCVTGQNVATGSRHLAESSFDTDDEPTGADPVAIEIAITESLARPDPRRSSGGGYVYDPAVCGPRGSVRGAGWLH